MKKLLIISVFIILLAMAVLILLFFKQQNNQQTLNNKNLMITQLQIIRDPAVAGQFYPAEKNELSQMIDEFLANATTTPITGQPRILIVPHAGYVFSGPTAAYGFKTLENYEYDTAIILGSSHNYPLDKLALYNGDVVKTPLGTVEINKNLTAALISDNNLIYANNNVHAPEHSLEVEIPFLQKMINNNFKLVLGLINSDDQKTLQSVANSIYKIFSDEKILLVISSDLSHYPNYDDALYSDARIIDSILTKDTNNFTDTFNSILAENRPGLDTCACGSSAIKIGMLLAEKLNLSGQILHYSNSGDTPDYGDKTRVVGYGAIVFASLSSPYQGEVPSANEAEGSLTKVEQSAALDLARNTLERAFNLTDKKFEDYKNYPIFSEKRGVFVTLKKNDELRGCIGLIEPIKELCPAIIEMAQAAAFDDPRFPELTANELADIKIEISVLTPLQKISDPKKEIKLGRHGVIVRQGNNSGVFLPQVATETGWDLDELMSQLCSQKAGLPTDCWKNGSVKIYTFEAQVMEEE